MSIQADVGRMDQSTSSGNTESRNALAFRMPEEDVNVPKRDQVEEDDSFYDLTYEEIIALHHASQKQKDIDDKLLPRSKREEEEAKLRPPKLEYDNTVIRIEFPDRMVLQGQFKIHETVNDLKEFVREHVKEPGAGFDLFTSPPKSILSEDAKLIDLKLVPTAKVYIGVRNNGNCQLVCDRMAVVPYECAQEAAKNVRRPIENEASRSKPGPSRTEEVQPRNPIQVQTLKKFQNGSK
uniref:Tether containing UBX domain for GLUT4 n=1 Tax=Lygus hesperus TaxID=30085 RepID=A0A0A9Z6F3_LYGHE